MGKWSPTSGKNSPFMLKRLPYILALSFLTLSNIYGQKKITMDGYISNTFSLYGIEDQTLWENSFMDRFNFRIYPTTWLTGAIDCQTSHTGSTVMKWLTVCRMNAATPYRVNLRISVVYPRLTKQPPRSTAPNTMSR